MNEIDLIQELRDACMCPTYNTDQSCLLCEAVKEIKRLRNLVDNQEKDRE